MARALGLARRNVPPAARSALWYGLGKGRCRPMTAVTYEHAVTPPSRWTARIALFAGLLLVAGVALHRIAGMATPIALNLFAASFAMAGVALVAGIVSAVLFWRQGGQGFARTVFGIAVSLAILAWPLSALPTFLRLPAINDVSTDTRIPPRFAALSNARDAGANPVAYPGEPFARAQADAYGDIVPFVVDRPVDEAFEIAVDVIRRVNRMKVVTEEPPGGKFGNVGLIEAVDRTLLIGFYDDVIVRIQGDRTGARIDIRSASRYGRHDLGRNAQRVRRLLKDLQVRLDNSIPVSAADRLARLKARGKLAVPKRPKDADQRTAGQRSSQGRDQSGAQRAPGQRASPPSRASGRAPDRQGQQPPR